MLGVVRHLPGNEMNPTVTQGRSRVLEQIRTLFTAHVLGDPKNALYRLTQQAWQQPADKQHPAIVGRDHDQSKQHVKCEHDPRLQHHQMKPCFGYIRIARRINPAYGVPDDPTEITPPEPESRAVP